jgi:hypothetical protein
MPQLSRVTTIPSDVVVRAVAIVLVLFNHSQPDVPFWNWKGGMTVLLMLMGLNLARFGLKNADPVRSRRAIGELLWRMFLPAFFFSSMFLLVYFLYDGRFWWAEVLFIANWISPWHVQIFPVWYSQVMLQLLMGFYLLFWIPLVARYLLRRPLAGMLVLFVIGLLLKLLVPLVWDTQHLWHQVPHNYVWNVALGGLVYFLAFEPNDVPFAKLAAIACIVVGGAVGYGSGRIEAYILVAAGVFIVTVRQVRLPCSYRRRSS